VLRGLSSRATRIRRPRLGAASMKKAMSAATATTGAPGTRPPSVPESVLCDERSWPNGGSRVRAGREDATCALARFAVGCELGWFLGRSRGSHATAAGVVGVIDPASRETVGAVSAASVVGAARDATSREDSAGAMTTCTSTAGTAGGDSERF
jgi:hypothetical protein